MSEGQPPMNTADESEGSYTPQRPNAFTEGFLRLRPSEQWQCPDASEEHDPQERPKPYAKIRPWVWGVILAFAGPPFRLHGTILMHVVEPVAEAREGCLTR